MNVNRFLDIVGRTIFVKYYYVFEKMPKDDCLEMISEQYTESTKRKKILYAKKIFKEGLQIEVLKVIINSKKVNSHTREKASRILSAETKKKRYCIL